jgi:urease accessory protein
MTPATDLIRLMQLSSSTLPVGGFTYSQGLEWAVESGWIKTEEHVRHWLAGLIDTTLKNLDVPVLVRMTDACHGGDNPALQRWSDVLIAHRETHELRLEERNRGRAMLSLVLGLDINVTPEWRTVLATTQTAGFAYVAKHWGIDRKLAAQGFAWSWLENMVVAAVKLVPLGQMAGQRILRDLAAPLATAVEQGLALTDAGIGSSTPAMAHASARHETQYTRLFRS